MKALPLLLLPFLLSCGNAGNSDTYPKGTQPAAHRQASMDGARVFTNAYAEAILGEPCHIVDSTYSGDTAVAWFSSSYKADSHDPASGDTGAVYFVFEEYVSVDAAHNRYTLIFKANRKNGAREITSMGDEAYYHTDNTHFRFIMARKNNRIIVMKINRMTSYTSDNAFRQIAEKIVAGM